MPESKWHVEEAIEEWSFEHRPILSMRDGSIASCKCMDRVFIRGRESWDQHTAESLVAAFDIAERGAHQHAVDVIAVVRNRCDHAATEGMYLDPNEIGDLIDSPVHADGGTS